VALLYKSLHKHGFSVGACMATWISRRVRRPRPVRKGEIPLLVASDVAPRPRYSGREPRLQFRTFRIMPMTSHRIGPHRPRRTCRTAISIVTPARSESIVAIEKLIGQTIPRTRAAPRFKPIDSSAAPAAIETERPRHFARRHGSGKVHAKARVTVHRRPASRAVNANLAAPVPPRRLQPATTAAAAALLRRRTPPVRALRRSAVPKHRRRHATRPRAADHSHFPAFLLRPVRAGV